MTVEWVKCDDKAVEVPGLVSLKRVVEVGML